MKRYTTNSTYSVRSGYSPGIMLYTSPIYPAKANSGLGSVAGRHYIDYSRQPRTEKSQQGSQH